MYSSISKNKRNTVAILIVFVALVFVIAWAFSFFQDSPSLFWAISIAGIVYALIQYFFASRLAVAMTGAREVQKADAPELYRVVENLAISTGMPMPKVYIIDDSAPNAFATGRSPKSAIVGATTGLLEIMDKRELNAVMAHEMSHVQNYDIRVGMVAFGLASAIGLLADIVLRTMIYGDNRDKNSNPVALVIALIVVVLAPVLATIMRMAISREREYLADASGSLMTRDSEGLASALEKLKNYGRPLQKQNSAAANLFMSNPLKPGFFSKLFSTHPPLEDRIVRLRNSAVRM